jgi:hypothetical protein
MFLQLLSSFARGCYFVTVAGTFAQGGTVTLVNDAAEVVCTENLIRVDGVAESPKLAE